MAGFSLTVESAELARVFTNGLAFFPARSPVKTALIRVTPNDLEVTGTDTVTVGRDTCAVRDFQGEFDGTPIEIELDRDGFTDIESNARKDKDGAGRLEFMPGDALLFRPGKKDTKADTAAGRDVTGQQTARLVDGETLQARDVWSLCDELLDVLCERELQVPHIFALDPSLLVRFNKVKTPADWDADRHVLDLHYQGDGNPILIKVGPSFVGAIMPIDRQMYTEKQPEGQEALW